MKDSPEPAYKAFAESAVRPALRGRPKGAKALNLGGTTNASAIVPITGRLHFFAGKKRKYEKIKPRTLSGFMDAAAAAGAVRALFGDAAPHLRPLRLFTALDTPIIESAEVLLAKAARDGKAIYRFQKGDSDLALRFEPHRAPGQIRGAELRAALLPFRRYQIGKVYRGERAQRGRFREFYQADIDIIATAA